MKRYQRNLLILTLPFLLMIAVNEFARPGIKEKPYRAYGVVAMNSSLQTPEKCTWSCHNNTAYCK